MQIRKNRLIFKRYMRKLYGFGNVMREHTKYTFPQIKNVRSFEDWIKLVDPLTLYFRAPPSKNYQSYRRNRHTSVMLVSIAKWEALILFFTAL